MVVIVEFSLIVLLGLVYETILALQVSYITTLRSVKSIIHNKHIHTMHSKNCFFVVQPSFLVGSYISPFFCDDCCGNSWHYCRRNSCNYCHDHHFASFVPP
eukprot:1089599_1